MEDGPRPASVPTTALQPIVPLRCTNLCTEHLVKNNELTYVYLMLDQIKTAFFLLLTYPSYDISLEFEVILYIIFAKEKTLVF